MSLIRSHCERILVLGLEFGQWELTIVLLIFELSCGSKDITWAIYIDIWKVFKEFLLKA